MANSKSALKPGDIIEWAYISSGKVVPKGELLYSTPMNKWIPVWKPSLLVSIDNETYSWSNDDKRIFSARVDDTEGLAPVGHAAGTIRPRKIG